VGSFDGIYLKFGSFGGMDPILPLCFVGLRHRKFGGKIPVHLISKSNIHQTSFSVTNVGPRKNTEIMERNQKKMKA